MRQSFFVVGLAALGLAGGCKKTPTAEPAAAAAPAAPAAAAPTGEAGPMTLAAREGKDLWAVLDTSLGAIKVQLFTRDAPKTVENFVALATGEKEWTDPASNQRVKRPLYDGTVFHRVIPEFMIQAGDPLGMGVGGPGYRFADEFQSGKIFDKPCLLAMANSGPNTNGSQFFITEKETPWLNNRHTIFGECLPGGIDIVKSIARVPRAPGDKPVTPVVLKKVSIATQAP